MKNKKMLAVLLAAFVVLMGGAFVLYNRLSKNVENNVLAVQETTAPPQENTEEKEPEATVQETTAKETTAPEAPAAPDFTVTDREGNSVRLSDFVGKPVILNFWASWCGPCKSEMPDFDAAYAEYGDEIHFVMVNLTDGFRETTDTAQKFIDEQGYQFPIYFDTESSGAIAYSVTTIPATYFIDADGKPVAQGRGALDGETLQKGIQMILPQ